MQSARNFIGGRIKFAAGVQRGHHHLRRRNFLTVDHHVVDGNAAAIVNHRDGVVEVDGDFNLGGETGQGFVDGIIHHFIHEMMQTQFARRPNVHGGTFAHCFHAAQHFDGVGIVVVVSAVASAIRRSDWSYDPVFCFGVGDGSIDLFGGHSAPRKCPDLSMNSGCELGLRIPAFRRKNAPKFKPF